MVQQCAYIHKSERLRTPLCENEGLQHIYNIPLSYRGNVEPSKLDTCVYFLI